MPSSTVESAVDRATIDHAVRTNRSDSFTYRTTVWTVIAPIAYKPLSSLEKTKFWTKGSEEMNRAFFFCQNEDL